MFGRLTTGEDSTAERETFEDDVDGVVGMNVDELAVGERSNRVPAATFRDRPLPSFARHPPRQQALGICDQGGGCASAIHGRQRRLDRHIRREHVDIVTHK